MGKIGPRRNKKKSGEEHKRKDKGNSSSLVAALRFSVPPFSCSSLLLSRRTPCFLSRFFLLHYYYQIDSFSCSVFSLFHFRFLFYSFRSVLYFFNSTGPFLVISFDPFFFFLSSFCSRCAAILCSILFSFGSFLSFHGSLSSFFILFFSLSSLFCCCSVL